MANTEKANEGSDKTKETPAASKATEKSTTAAAAAKAADAGGDAALTQADIDKAVAEALAERDKGTDELREKHKADLEAAAANGEKKGYQDGVKDGREAAVPEGSKVFTADELAAEINKASDEGYQKAIDEIEGDEDDKRAFRGSIMEILLLIPANLRRIRPEDRLNDMVDFLSVLKPTERAIAIPMIRSIALMEPNDIPNGRYKADVLNALNVVVHGNSIDAVASDTSLDQGAAFSRLMSVVNSNDKPGGIPEDQPTPYENQGDFPLSSSDPNAAAQRMAFITGGLAGGSQPL